MVGMAGAVAAGIITDHQEASDFFGGKPAKVVYLSAGSYSTIKYIDFSESNLQARTVLSGSSGDGSNIQISPDGSRVAYDNGSKCFVAKVEAGTSVKHEIGSGINPQWWFHPSNGKQYILMQRGDAPGGDNGIYMQEVDQSGAPVGAETMLVDQPQANGGRSPDGKFLGNVDEKGGGCPYGHGMYVLSDPLAVENAGIDYWIYATAEGWYNGGSAPYRGYCNGSIVQAPAGHQFYGAMMHMGSGHVQIFVRKPDPAHYTTATPVQLGTDGADGSGCSNGESVIPEMAQPMKTLLSPQFMGLDQRDNHWGYSDWSTHPDYIAATGGTSSTSSGNKSGYFVNMAKAFNQAGFHLKWADDGIAQPDLWVESETSATIRSPRSAHTISAPRTNLRKASMVDLRGREVANDQIGHGVYFDFATGTSVLRMK
jgi:hypothetical protein